MSVLNSDALHGRPEHAPASNRAVITRRLADLERRIAEHRGTIELLEAERQRMRVRLQRTYPL